MTAAADEIWAILREAAQARKENEQLIKELLASQKDTGFKFNELLASQKDTGLKFLETDQFVKDLQRDTALMMKETALRMKENERTIKEHGEQIGGLGKKLGSFTEGLALPSMEKILTKQFGMEVISPSVRVSKGGENLEIDVLAYANGDINQAVVVEVKSHLREESIRQLKKLLKRFRSYFPEHKDKTVYGILAAVDISAALRKRALHEGLYVARIHDNIFEMDTPDGFKPKAY